MVALYTSLFPVRRSYQQVKNANTLIRCVSMLRIVFSFYEGSISGYPIIGVEVLRLSAFAHQIFLQLYESVQV